MIDEQCVEQNITISNGKVTLDGTLCTPLQQSAAQTVLLLADSGPLDRNQNSVQAQLNIFNAVASHLAAHGVASLRYDKRGCGKSKGNHDSAGHSDLTDDAHCWLLYLKNESPVKNSTLFLLGHGEGTLMSPQLAKNNDFVAGQILLSPFLENYEIIIRRQAENALKEIAELSGFKGKFIRFFLRLSGDQIAKQKKLIQRIRKSRKATFKIRKQVINAKWIREMVTMEAATVHAGVSIPTLIIGGEKDLQCAPDDVDKLASILTGPVQTQVFDNLTHILRTDPDKPSVQHYLALSAQDLDERVLQTISDWLKTQDSHLRGDDTLFTVSKTQ